MARTARIPALIGAALLLAGCAAQPMSHQPAPGDPFGAARALPDAPEQVLDPATCGEVELDQGGTLTDEHVDCINDAVDADGDAGLAWSQPTIEGDPLLRFAIVRSGVLEVWSTSVFDRWGPGPGWSRSSGCERLHTETGCTPQSA